MGKFGMHSPTHGSSAAVAFLTYDKWLGILNWPFSLDIYNFGNDDVGGDLINGPS